MSNHCVYDKCPDCGGESCSRCDAGDGCICDSATIQRRAAKRAAEYREAERKLAEGLPEGWF